MHKHWALFELTLWVLLCVVNQLRLFVSVEVELRVNVGLLLAGGCCLASFSVLVMVSN